MACDIKSRTAQYSQLLIDHQRIPTIDLGPPQVSAKFGTAAGWAKDTPRNGGDRMGSDNYRMGSDRVSDVGGVGGDRYPPSYDRGGGGYASSRDERGYGGGGGYDRPAPIYREERGRDRDIPREASRELPRYDPRGRSPPPAYYDDRRRGGGSGGGGGYDDRYGISLGHF
jgi:hypothetical protein